MNNVPVWDAPNIGRREGMLVETLIYQRVVLEADYLALRAEVERLKAGPAPIHVTPKPRHGQEVQRYQMGPDGDEWVKAEDYAALNEHSALMQMRLMNERDEANKVCEQWRQWTVATREENDKLKAEVASWKRLADIQEQSLKESCAEVERLQSALREARDRHAADLILADREDRASSPTGVVK